MLFNSLVCLALGARLGANTYSAGTLLDPPLAEFGANCIIGHVVVMSGASIDDGASVSTDTVVLKGTQIGT
jgi:UDP-3-O-[3-hydroxymyristoyl] glucosamine N-acyltransferase